MVNTPFRKLAFSRIGTRISRSGPPLIHEVVLIVGAKNSDLIHSHPFVDQILFYPPSVSSGNGSEDGGDDPFAISKWVLVYFLEKSGVRTAA